MATRRVSRSNSGRSRNPSPPAPARSIKLTEEGLDDLHRDLLGARAAVMTAILALEGKGVDHEVSTSLRMHVLNPLDHIAFTVNGREVRP